MIFFFLNQNGEPVCLHSSTTFTTKNTPNISFAHQFTEKSRQDWCHCPLSLCSSTCVLSIHLNLILKQFYFPTLILTDRSALAHTKTGQGLRRHNVDTAWKLDMPDVFSFCVSVSGTKQLLQP